MLRLIAALLVGIVFMSADTFALNNMKNIHLAIKQTTTDTTQPAKKTKSPRMTTTGAIGNNAIIIDYSSPRVRGRVIWGGLVSFGTVWVTGGHDATSVQFSSDVMIGDTIVKAGKYALFTIPDKKEWTVILNKNFDQHLTDDYDEKLDVLRFKVLPQTRGSLQEELQFSITTISANEGAVTFTWEKLTWSFVFKTR